MQKQIKFTTHSLDRISKRGTSKEEIIQAILNVKESQQKTIKLCVD
jgi:hypothetical protein